jgi:hypothetical protein
LVKVRDLIEVNGRARRVCVAGRPQTAVGERQLSSVSAGNALLGARAAHSYRRHLRCTGLKREIGDSMHALQCGTGHNLRLNLAALRAFLAFVLTIFGAVLHCAPVAQFRSVTAIR